MFLLFDDVKKGERFCMTNQFGETLHISLKAHIIFAFYIGGESKCLHLIGGESIK